MTAAVDIHELPHLLGGPPAVTSTDPELFRWPIVTTEDEQAVLDVLRSGNFSGNDIAKAFEAEWAAYNGTEFALSFVNGTASLNAALWACGVGAGDEVICPTLTYWASALGALHLGATVNFADVLPDRLTIDPADLEHRIGPRTKAIVVVHWGGRPCEMDEILAIARRHGLKVIEDNSHSHGSLYKGRMCGSIGDVAAMSMMSGKSFPIGEGGMLVTDDREIYERAVAYGFYERTGGPSNYAGPGCDVTIPELNRFAGLPLAPVKNRLVQTCAAMGRVQLKHYARRIAEIDRAMNRFWDLLEDCPGLRGVRPTAEQRQAGTSMGGWYCNHATYHPEEVAGLPVARFAEAVAAEGVEGFIAPERRLLHLHPAFHELDYFRQGQPTAVAFGQRDVRQVAGSLPAAEHAACHHFIVPWFKHDDAATIERYAQAINKIARHADRLQ